MIAVSDGVSISPNRTWRPGRRSTPPWRVWRTSVRGADDLVAAVSDARGRQRCRTTPTRTDARRQPRRLHDRGGRGHPVRAAHGERRRGLPGPARREALVGRAAHVRRQRRGCRRGQGIAADVAQPAGCPHAITAGGRRPRRRRPRVLAAMDAATWCSCAATGCGTARPPTRRSGAGDPCCRRRPPRCPWRRCATPGRLGQRAGWRRQHLRRPRPACRPAAGPSATSRDEARHSRTPGGRVTTGPETAPFTRRRSRTSTWRPASTPSTPSSPWRPAARRRAQRRPLRATGPR